MNPTFHQAGRGRQGVPRTRSNCGAPPIAVTVPGVSAHLGTDRHVDTAGVALMLLSVLAYTANQALARYLGPAVGSWAKTFYRCLFTLPFTVVWMKLNSEPLRLVNLRLLLVRGISGAIAVTCYFWAIDLVGLLMATMYSYSYSALAIVFAALIYRERFVPWLILPVLAAMAGLYLIVNPRIEGVGLGDVVGLAAAVSGGVARSTVRELRKTDSPGNVVLVFMACAVLFTAAGVFILPDQGLGIVALAGSPRRAIWMAIVGMGASSCVGNILMTTSFRRLSTAVGSILSMMTLPLTAIVALLVFREPLTATRLVGGLLILAAGLATPWLGAPPLSGHRGGR